MTTYIAIILTFLIALFGLIFKPNQDDIKGKKTYVVKLSKGGWIILIVLILSSLLTWKISYDDSEEKSRKIVTDSLRHKEQIISILKVDSLEKLSLENQQINYENQVKITKGESEILRLKLENANNKLATVEGKLFPICPVVIYYNLIFDLSCNEASSLLDDLTTKAGSLDKIETITSLEIFKSIMASKNQNINNLFRHNWGDNSLYFDNFQSKIHLWLSNLDFGQPTFEIKEGIGGSGPNGYSYYLIESLVGKGNCSGNEAKKYPLDSLFNATVTLKTFYQKAIPQCLKPTLQRVGVKIKFPNIEAFEITSMEEKLSSDLRHYDYIFSNWKNREY